MPAEATEGERGLHVDSVTRLPRRCAVRLGSSPVVSHRACRPGIATTGPTVRLRPPTACDGEALWRLAAAVGLDPSSPDAYVLRGDRLTASSVVAVTPGGTPSSTLHSAVEGAGTGGRMLDELLRRTGVGRLEATVTPSNEASPDRSARWPDDTTQGSRTPVHPEDLFPTATRPRSCSGSGRPPPLTCQQPKERDLPWRPSTSSNRK